MSCNIAHQLDSGDTTLGVKNLDDKTLIFLK